MRGPNGLLQLLRKLVLAAVAYDVFRLPFVFAREWGISSVVPPMNLFKVFPRFGAMILAQPLEQLLAGDGGLLTGPFSSEARFMVAH